MVDLAYREWVRMGDEKHLVYGINRNGRAGILPYDWQRNYEARLGCQIVEFGAVVGFCRGTGNAGLGVNGQAIDVAVAQSGELGDVAGGEIDQSNYRSTVGCALRLRQDRLVGHAVIGKLWGNTAGEDGVLKLDDGPGEVGSDGGAEDLAATAGETRRHDHGVLVPGIALDVLKELLAVVNGRQPCPVDLVALDWIQPVIG